ncbi:MAG: RNA methyltransferase [Gallionellaceae bacterium]|jgi:tRNA/rRNA methyltransferase|nr:RNA methyltransferase [Gallionellaceae bacterium]
MSSKPDALANIRIVLCQTSHPGNIGAAARAMKTMGLRDLRLVRPKKFPHAEAEAMASGATDVLAAATVCDTLEEALTGCAFAVGLSARKRELTHELANSRAAAEHAIQLAASQQVALVFGTEMSGLSNDELIRCHQLAMIPANPEYSSLNLAAAVQVMAYELRMAVLGKIATETSTPFPLASHDDVEGFYRHLEAALTHTGFLDPAVPKRLMPRLRRLFTRARLEKEEVNILRGILKSMQPPPRD